MTPERGDWATVRTSGPVALAIRVVTGQRRPNNPWWRVWRFWQPAEHNHAVGYTGAGQIVSADPWKVRLTSLANYAGCPISWYSLTQLMPGGRDAALNLDPARSLDELRADVALGYLALQDRPYNVLDLPALLASAMGWNSRWVWARLAKSPSVICSQTVTLACTTAQIHLCPDKDAVRVTPEDLDCVIAGSSVPANR